MRVVVWLLTGLILLGIIYSFSTCRMEQTDGRIVLTMFSEPDRRLVQLNHKRIALFEKQNPDIKVRLVLGYPDKYLTMVSGGRTPDVAFGGHQDISYYAKRGAIIPLDEYIAKDKDYSLDDYFPVAAQCVYYNGKVYALPDNGSPVALLYNKDMFDEYNKKHPGKQLTYPNKKWTWDDFRYAAKALTRDDDNDGRTDVYGAFVSFWRNRWPVLVWHYGGDVISADKKRCLMDTPEALAGIKVLSDMMWVDKSAPTTDTQVAGASRQGDASFLFKEEYIAMMMTTRYFYNDLQGKTKFVWDIAPLPKGPAGGASLFISDVWTVSSTTPYPDQAWRLAKFLVSEESSRMCMKEGRAIVCHQKVAEEILRNPKPGSDLPEHDYMWIDIMLDSRAKDFEYKELGQYFYKAMDEMSAIAMGRRKPLRTPEEACRNFTRLYQKGLDILWEEEGGP